MFKFNPISYKHIFNLNLYPSLYIINEVLIDLIQSYKWNTITVLFQEEKRIQKLIQHAAISDHYDQKIKFQFRMILPNISYWNLLLREVKESGSAHIIVDLESNLVEKFLLIVIFHYFVMDLHS